MTEKALDLLSQSADPPKNGPDGSESAPIGPSERADLERRAQAIIDCAANQLAREEAEDLLEALRR